MFRINEKEKKFEWTQDGVTSFVSYYIKNNKYVLWHSEVPMSERGKGIGRNLVTNTFKYLQDNNLKAGISCSYINMVAMRNPEYRSIFIQEEEKNEA
ncbi:GNAT family N-acetyltransferase [Lacibacter sp. MH-610]|jgi:predicted GNAT family acetyltransferase|uniref:GNAT family N-acetyltransferase n=1 Tax=Chitinophagaceae TaxID=563835 RepID=UPI001AD4B4F8|nr:N-acetyltransferase [Chitinophagales bacterium]